MTPVSPPLGALRRTLANRNFALFTAGNVVSFTGSWMQRVAVGWVTWHLTESASWLGAVAAAEFLPAVLVAPIVGALGDRYDRRRMAMIGQVLATGQAVLLAVLTLTGTILPLWILLLQVFAGLLQPLLQTARLVLVPSLVPRENLGTAVAITSVIFNTARIAGPMLAGLAITTIGAGYAFAFNALSYLAVIYSLIAMRVPPRPAAPDPRGLWSAVFDDIVQGGHYVLASPLLKRAIPVSAVVAAMTWPLGDLFAGISDTEFGRGATGLALLTSAQGVGSIVGALFLLHRPAERAYGTAIVSALAGGLCLAAFGLTSLFWMALILCGVISLCNTLVGVGTQTTAHITAEDHMRARTLGLWYTLTRGAAALGAVAIGAIAHVTGFQAPLVGAGLITAAVAIYVLWKKPAELQRDPA